MDSQHPGKRIVLYLAMTSLAGSMATVAAQSPGAGGMPQNTPGQQPTLGQTTPGEQTPRTPTMPGEGTPGAASLNSENTMADQAFLRKTLEDNVAEMQMGQLAAQKSPSDDVKQYGQRMLQVHQELDTQLKPVAEKLGVNEPKNPSKKDKQEIERLQALSGSDFDSEFLKAMLKEQRLDVKNFKDEEQRAEDPTVERVAKMDMPVLSQHLQLLKELAQEHNVPLESKK